MSNIVKFEFDGLTFQRLDDSDETRVLDVSLAERLGYSRPRDVRKLVERLCKEKKLNESEVRATVAQTSLGGGRPATEYWLTESQALKVIAKSETDVADAILDQVIRIFVQVRKGLVQAPARTAEHEAMLAQIKTMSAQIEQLSSVVLPLADHPDRFLPRAELQDYPRELGRLRQLIGNAARAQGKHWNSVHGEIVRRYQLRSYKRLPYTVWAQVSAWLTEVLSTPHKQLPAAPHPGGQRSFDWKCN